MNRPIRIKITEKRPLDLSYHLMASRRTMRMYAYWHARIQAHHGCTHPLTQPLRITHLRERIMRANAYLRGWRRKYKHANTHAAPRVYVDAYLNLLPIS